MKINALLALWLLIASNTALSADWDQIIKTDAYYIEVDIDAYTTIDGFPVIRTRSIYKAPQKMPNQSGAVYYQKIRTVQFDCKKDKIRDLEVKFLDAKNHLISQEPATAFKAVKAEHHNRDIASLVCQVHKMLGGN